MVKKSLNAWPQTWWCVTPHPISIYVVTVRRGDVHSVAMRWRYMAHTLLKKS
jgi:hypothetical protein